ncbi:uncharacterized protein EDB91DRAFT_1248571 [Suillus paluster]|uniref:uncharacterized protein n=1 Tax=Suillus paluster TaxID=48578 RepID=UPI001B86C461|nr:uncharacterized protein EDB91DRAFT_1248571 [Suillus paluster]KAG1739812.1 hypothetical protein EDB91DRAFT_1248571 [Suillus paluster]
MSTATFTVLEFFHELILQGKLNIFDFYNTLLRISDGPGVTDFMNHYNDLSRIMRQWQHVMSLKRAGHGHDPAGIEATSAGSLVIECAACPHPGRNLPDGWETTTRNSMYLYTLYLSMDTNFQLPLKNHHLRDIELAPGWSFFVEESAFQAVIAESGERNKGSTCQVKHDPIVRANVHNKDG